MKYKISVSISEPVLMKLKERMRTMKFRNQSQLVEQAVEKFLQN